MPALTLLTLCAHLPHAQFPSPNAAAKDMHQLCDPKVTDYRFFLEFSETSNIWASKGRSWALREEKSGIDKTCTSRRALSLAPKDTRLHRCCNTAGKIKTCPLYNEWQALKESQGEATRRRGKQDRKATNTACSFCHKKKYKCIPDPQGGGACMACRAWRHTPEECQNPDPEWLLRVSHKMERCRHINQDGKQCTTTYPHNGKQHKFA